MVLIPAPEADLCLSFADTRYWRGTATPTESMQTPDDLAHWAVTTEKLPADLVRHIIAAAPAALLSEALRLREAIFRCFAARAAMQAAAEADLALLNAALASAPARRRIAEGGWDVGEPPATVATLLAPTLWSAADLLVGVQLPLVRQCANAECAWLFLDNSKSGNRRWCSMSACGNRAKAHRHYLRSKEK